MGKQYQPNVPFDVAFKILKLNKVFINGVNSTEYVEETTVYYCSAKSYGGTDRKSVV